MLIEASYLTTMARYGRWQNDALFAAAVVLSDAERRADRGAFWGSIHGTLSHIYWADRIWMSRLNVAEPPNVPLKESAAFVGDFHKLTEARSELDDAIVGWADAFAPGAVTGSLRWYSGAAGREVDVPLGVVLTHFFNHQTHHRGQAHALITAAGASTTDTDLFLMPRELWPRLAIA